MTRWRWVTRADCAISGPLSPGSVVAAGGRCGRCPRRAPRGRRALRSRCSAAGGPRRLRGHSARRHRPRRRHRGSRRSPAMAKEGAQRAEETEQMIDKEGGREANESGAGGSLRAGDAKEMRAVVLSAFGGLNKLRVSKKAMPEPQEGELKIRVKACGLNFIDLMVRQGNIDNPPKTPLVPGFECSGIVEALGDSVKGFEIGDRVMAFVNYNAWAEVVCTPVEFVYKIPDDMTFSEAAAFPMNFVTAYMMLFEVANLREGMSVLVHSAGGGVGQAVAQLCSTIPNVTVFGTASSFKHEAIKNSVTHLFDRNADYVQEVKRISADGVDIVLDCLCGENTGKGLSLLKPLGTYILYGSSNMVTGETKSFFSFAKSWWQVEKVNPIKLYEENKVIAGFSLLNLLFKQNRGGLVKGVMDKLLNLYNSKKIKPVVDSLWALEEVKEAMQRIHDRGNIGKLILDVEKAPTPLMANDSTETSEAGEEEEDHEGDNENKERMPFIQ
uniref:Vesicle amine transport 1 like n=1 Tax=Junco hyemalis TaxID=40217 RepID=A0A8C5NQ48_JUNHY